MSKVKGSGGGCVSTVLLGEQTALPEYVEYLRLHLNTESFALVIKPLSTWAGVRCINGIIDNTMLYNNKIKNNIEYLLHASALKQT